MNIVRNTQEAEVVLLTIQDSRLRRDTVDDTNRPLPN